MRLQTEEAQSAFQELKDVADDMFTEAKEELDESCLEIWERIEKLILLKAQHQQQLSDAMKAANDIDCARLLMDRQNERSDKHMEGLLALEQQRGDDFEFDS